ncbi:MAG TPA: radical SAM family heme chaperone HemW [Candidatus Sulfotelmatobacter sp.]|jgi:oxygen-independent coproporphyrinogen-3 oxidase|nr:radical SAM family heme chaperone HemW [Candidatus Sulfotelmatobacter sp.]
MPNLGVYIQVPFCQTKCTYCNFHTGVVSPGRFAPYAAAVCREVANHRQLLESAGVTVSATAGSSAESVDTVYIGGGTPSLLEPELLAGILQSLRLNFDCSFREVTLEADPETIDAERAAQWAAAGFNRVSFGTQSFVDEELKSAGRMHRREDIYRAVPILRAAGIRNISFDLIAGLPKQTHASWRQSLAEAIALSPEHISIYMMEIDEGSRLGLEVLQSGSRYSAKDIPSEEAMAEFYELAQSELKSSGFVQYEISNWAKPGYESRHNLKYWRREPYLGFGAGAHSFSGTQRWANRHDAAAYVAAISEGKSAIESVDTLTPALALEEEFFLGLRQLSGIDLARIEREYGVSLGEKVGQLTSHGMVETRGDNMRLAADKLSVSSEIIVELLRSLQVTA